MPRLKPALHPRDGLSRARSTALSAAVLLVTAAAGVGLTACGGSSNAQQAQSPSPQEVETYKKQHTELLELVSCARRHGVPLPAPTSNNKINTRGLNLKSPRRKAALNYCYQKVVQKAAREEQAERAEREAGPPRLGEGPPAGQAQTAGSGGSAFQQEHERLSEVVSCARRQGVHLPEPDAHNNINTQSVVKTRHQKNVMNACIRSVVRRAEERQRGQAEAQQDGSPRPGEETPSG